jgi:hypothetical protein
MPFGVGSAGMSVIQAPEPGPRIMRYELTDFEWTANQALVDTAAQDGLEQPSQQITIAETTMPVLGEGRMVGHVTIEPKTAEPTVGHSANITPRN